MRSNARRHWRRASACRSARMVCDLEQPEPPLPEHAWDLVVCVRFLHRPLLPRIARALAPGGHLVFETFRDGQQRFGKPVRARFLLQPGELLAAFPGLEVLHHDEPAPAEGPWTERLHARRPPHAGVGETPARASGPESAP